jgi:murein DD-endopeptidase MepM/ murein hydrolase activator NlpD
MRRLLVVFSLFFAAALVVLWWAKRDGAVQVDDTHLAPVIGRGTRLDLTVRVPGPGLEHVTLRLKTGEQTYLLHEAHFAPLHWRGSGVESYELRVTPDFSNLNVADGPAQLELWLSTYAWRLRPLDRAPVWTRTVQLDFTPPRLELLTQQHNVRLGGVELAIWRQGEETVRAGVEVGPYFFPATHGFFAEPALALAFFAVPQDLDTRAQAVVVASDAAGNEARVPLPLLILPQRFAERTLTVDDDFLARKVPEIERDAGVAGAGDLLQRYLYINRELRKQNEARIRTLTRESAPQMLWHGRFHRQPNAAPLSSFADRRTYLYKGQQIDHQVHLGYDLASLRQSPVEAANRGRVVFAGNLGIYGNTVILDHGLGLFTLYGHLSSIDVQPGTEVEKAQVLGKTGETGLAGGDHLHFSVMLFGVHVDPVEWWDRGWIERHVLAKLRAYPTANLSRQERSAE